MTKEQTTKPTNIITLTPYLPEEEARALQAKAQALQAHARELREYVARRQQVEAAKAAKAAE